MYQKWSSQVLCSDMLKSILLLSDYCSKNLRLWGPLCSRDRQRAMIRNLKRTENRDFNIYLVHYVPWQQTWQVISLSDTEQENWCGVVSCVIWKQKIEDSELTESNPCVKQYWARHLHSQGYSRDAVLFSVTQEWLKSNLHYCSKCVLHLKV